MNDLNEDIVNRLTNFVDNSTEILISASLFYSIADQIDTEFFPFRNLVFKNHKELNLPEGDIIDLFINKDYNLEDYLINSNIKYSKTTYKDIDVLY